MAALPTGGTTTAAGSDASQDAPRSSRRAQPTEYVTVACPFNSDSQKHVNKMCRNGLTMTRTSADMHDIQDRIGQLCTAVHEMEW